MRKILTIMCLIILLVSMATVSAEDVNQSISDMQILGSADGGTFAELQEKINNAEEGSTIKLENNYTYDDSFEYDYISIAKNITVDGNGYTIDAKSASGIFNVTAADVVLNNIAFINAISDNGIGGAIYSEGNLGISNSIFENNAAEIGGAVYSEGSLTVSDSIFSGNFAEKGGAIYFIGSAIVEDSNFTGNVAHWLGGGAVYANSDLTVNSSNFIANDAPDWDYQGNIGGAIYSLGPLDVTYSSFINNTAGNVHEKANNAIYAYAAYANIKNSAFVNNYVILTKFSSDFDLIFNSTTVPSGEGVMISTIFNDKNITGNVTIRINDDEKVLDIVNGSADLKLFGLAPGTYVVNAEYPENEYWWGYSRYAKFNVFSGSYVIDAENLVKYYGGEERFAVYVREIDGMAVSGKKVVININGQDYSRTSNEDGYASVPVNLNSGQYNVTVKCEDSSVNSSITVKSTVSGKNITKTFRNATQYYAEFLDSEGNLLSNSGVMFNINGLFYDRRTNDLGVAKLNINLNPGEYIITAINLNSGEMYSNVRLLDDQGNPVGAGVNVTFNINGVFYTRTTNATGHAKLNINLEPGTYIITAIYKGLAVANSITVLPVLEAKDLEMKYHDGSKFEAKLIDGEGNPYAGQNITFNVNGVIYERTTDASGIVRLNINLMPGEYIITSSYNQSNIANKITISS